MEKKDFLSKFNLYDQLGFIFVGFYQIFLISGFYILLSNKEFTAIFKMLTIENVFSIVLISYFLGNIIQAVSNVFVKEEKGNQDKYLDFIFKKTISYFELQENLDRKYVFQYCYLFALSNDFSGQVRMVHSMYGMYRGFYCVSLVNGGIQLIFLVIKIIFSPSMPSLPVIESILSIIMLFLLTWLFYNRKNRFYKYLSEKTLITFDILIKNKI